MGWIQDSPSVNPRDGSSSPDGGEKRKGLPSAPMSSSLVASKLSLPEKACKSRPCQSWLMNFKSNEVIPWQ